eukprot:g53801.t1
MFARPCDRVETRQAKRRRVDKMALAVPLTGPAEHITVLEVLQYADRRDDASWPTLRSRGFRRKYASPRKENKEDEEKRMRLISRKHSNHFDREQVCHIRGGCDLVEYPAGQGWGMVVSDAFAKIWTVIERFQTKKIVKTKSSPCLEECFTRIFGGPASLATNFSQKSGLKVEGKGKCGKWCTLAKHCALKMRWVTLAKVAARDPALASRVESYRTLRENKQAFQLGMLSHRAGFRHYGSNFEYLYNGSDTMEMYGNEPLLFPPGTKYFYSSFGYNLAGRMLESMSGLSFEAMAQLVARAMSLDTLVMAGSTNFPAKQYLRSCLVIGRDYKETQYLRSCLVIGRDYKETVRCLLNDTFSSMDYDIAVAKKGPAGGLRATAKDLARFGALVVLSDSVLSGDNKAAILSGKSQVSANDWYGMGWHMDRQKDAEEFWHSGGAVGGIAYVRVLKPAGISMGFVCDTQYDGSILGDLSDAVETYFAPEAKGEGAAFLAGTEPTPARPKPAREITQATLHDRCTGAHESQRDIALSQRNLKYSN